MMYLYLILYRSLSYDKGFAAVHLLLVYFPFASLGKYANSSFRKPGWLLVMTKGSLLFTKEDAFKTGVATPQKACFTEAPTTETRLGFLVFRFQLSLLLR